MAARRAQIATADQETLPGWRSPRRQVEIHLVSIDPAPLKYIESISEAQADGRDYGPSLAASEARGGGERVVGLALSRARLGKLLASKTRFVTQTLNANFPGCPRCGSVPTKSDEPSRACGPCPAFLQGTAQPRTGSSRRPVLARNAARIERCQPRAAPGPGEGGQEGGRKINES